MADVAADVGVLAAVAVILLSSGSVFFYYALRRAKHRGTLAQY